MTRIGSYDGRMQRPTAVSRSSVRSQVSNLLWSTWRNGQKFTYTDGKSYQHMDYFFFDKNPAKTPETQRSLALFDYRRAL